MFSPSGPSRNDGQHPCKTGPLSDSDLGMGGGARLNAMGAARPSQGLNFSPVPRLCGRGEVRFTTDSQVREIRDLTR